VTPNCRVWMIYGFLIFRIGIITGSKGEDDLPIQLSTGPNASLLEITSGDAGRPHQGSMPCAWSAWVDRCRKGGLYV